MSNKSKRKFLSLFILLITLGLFCYYAVTHPSQVINPILNLRIITIVLIVVAYLGVLLTNAAILHYSLKLLKLVYPFGEAFLLSAYSSIVNFFGPLQSGPGFRGLYLKKKHGVRLRDYSLTLLLYYGFFGVVNAVMLAVIALLKFQALSVFFWLSLLGVIVLGAIGYLNRNRLKQLGTHAPLKLVTSRQSVGILMFTIAQCVCMYFIYYAELSTVDRGVRADQVIAYTAVANLTLFVALTPGAIGIRESFLIFSQELHTISSETVIAASVIDRALYFFLLLILFLITLGFHVKKRLGTQEIGKENL